uniref:Uncharacterized protein n=1 Tax=Ditylenchus dipsaci TaxID=166011 RepID=A0A915DRB0_9BILA
MISLVPFRFVRICLIVGVLGLLHGANSSQPPPGHLIVFLENFSNTSPWYLLIIIPLLVLMCLGLYYYASIATQKHPIFISMCKSLRSKSGLVHARNFLIFRVSFSIFWF